MLLHVLRKAFPEKFFYLSAFFWTYSHQAKHFLGPGWKRETDFW
jgi:hypothetical protein